MPALVSTDYVGRIVWLGVVPDRAAGLRSASRDHLDLEFAGPVGEAHGGVTRASCARVTSQYPKGTEIRNTRQLCIVSQEELAAIASDMGLASIAPHWIGANVVLQGLPDLTFLPPSSRLQSPNGASVVVDMENRPCHLPAPEIDAEAPGFGRMFKSAAKGRRGVVGWVERPGVWAVGDGIRLHVPSQRAWAP